MCVGQPMLKADQLTAPNRRFQLGPLSLDVSTGDTVLAGRT